MVKTTKPRSRLFWRIPRFAVIVLAIFGPAWLVEFLLEIGEHIVYQNGRTVITIETDPKA